MRAKQNLNLRTLLRNESPLVVELPDGEYDIGTSSGVVQLSLRSEFVLSVYGVAGQACR